jgi:hypothetical protein
MKFELLNKKVVKEWCSMCMRVCVILKSILCCNFEFSYTYVFASCVFFFPKTERFFFSFEITKKIYIQFFFCFLNEIKKNEEI